MANQVFLILEKGRFLLQPFGGGAFRIDSKIVNKASKNDFQNF